MNQNAQSGSSGAFGSGGSGNMRQDTDRMYNEVGGSGGTSGGMDSAGSTGAGMSSQRPMNTDSDVMGDDEDNTARRR